MTTYRDDSQDGDFRTGGYYSREPRTEPLTPYLLDTLSREQGLWYEAPEEQEEAFERARCRERRLKWVRSQMRRCLPRQAQRCLTLYYMEGLTLREVAEREGLSPMAARRVILKAVALLRIRARRSGLM